MAQARRQTSPAGTRPTRRRSPHSTSAPSPIQAAAASPRAASVSPYANAAPAASAAPSAASQSRPSAPATSPRFQASIGPIAIATSAGATSGTKVAVK